MSFSLVIQVLSAFFSLLIALIVLRNIKRNPYLNIFILLIFTLNLIRIPFSLTYELGWQTAFREIPKPFNILFLSNVVFFHYYIRSLVLKEKRSLKYFWLSLLIPLFLFLVNLLFSSKQGYELILKGFNFPIATGFIVYFFFKSVYIVYGALWGSSRKVLRFANYKLIRVWVLILLTMYAFASLRVMGIFVLDLVNKQDQVPVSYPYFSSLLYLGMLIILFMYPEILYGLRRENIALPLNNASSSSNGLLPSFNWCMEPKPIHNKLDLSLALKFNERMDEITRKLESKMAIQAIVKDPGINSILLAEKLDIPRTYMHFLFKYHADFTFVAYRSKIRVFYAISKMKEDFLSKNTMDALARECGFSSYNPFYAAFKAEMGVGPSDVLAQLKQGLNQSQEL